MAKSSTLLRNDRKSTNAEENSATIDRISKLPESVLCHILSFLPTQKAVATSILSNRWRALWTLVLDINLDDDYDPRSRSYDDYDSCDDDDDSCLPSDYDKPRARFSDIVNSILTLRKALSIRKFRLSIRHEPCNQSQFNEWVSAAVACNVEQMDFSVDLKETVHLLPSFFTCKSIVVLKLFGDITLHTFSTVYLPKLKTLDLTMKVDGPSLNWFLSGCPVLEDFTVHINVESSISICVTSLRRLRIYFEYVANELRLNTPSLEYLSITGNEFPHYLGGNLQNLVDANINISSVGSGFDYFEEYFMGANSITNEDKEPDSDLVVKLIRGIHKAKFLHLTLQSLDVPNRDLREFPNLIRLELELACFSWNFLVNMLQKCHKLEVLVIHKKNRDFHEPKWTKPTSVPDCVASTLTMVEFRGYADLENELNVIAYFLKNANFLKKVMIDTAIGMNSKGKRRLFEKLSMLQKRSDACECELVFH